MGLDSSDERRRLMNMTNTNRLVVTVRSNSEIRDYATFTWSADMQDCDLVSVGLSDEQIDGIISAKGHEGADVPGYVVTIA